MPIEAALLKRIPQDSLDRWIEIFLWGSIASLSFSITLFEITSWIFIALCGLSLIRQRDLGGLKSTFFAIAVCYFAINILSMTQSAYMAASLRGAFKVLKNILFCSAAFYFINSEKKFWRVFNCFLIVAFLVGVDALIQGLTGTELIRSRNMTPYFGDTKRLTGPFRHANDFGAYLSFTVILFFGAVFLIKRKAPGIPLFFYILGLTITSACLVGTYSRGAWAAVGVAVVLLAVFTRSKWLIFLIVLIGVWGSFFAPDLVKTRALSLFDPKNGTVIERKELWQGAFRMIRERPVLGFGVNTYAKNEPLYKDKTLKIDDQYAHNGYLQMAAEIGSLGLLAFLSAIIFLFASSMHDFLASPGSPLKSAGLTVLAGILSFLIHSATDTNLQSVVHINTLWLAMGIALAARSILVTEKLIQRT